LIQNRGYSKSSIGEEDVILRKSSSSPIGSQEPPIGAEPDFRKSFFLSYMHRSDYDLPSLSSDAISSQKWLLFMPQILQGRIVHSAMGGIAPVSDRWFLTLLSYFKSSHDVAVAQY